MPFTLIPLFPNEVTYQKQFFMVIYYVQCLHINFFHLIFVKPLNKRFGVPLYLAKTFNFKNYTRMAFKSDNLRNWVIPEKIHSHVGKSHWMGAPVNGFGNPDGRGALNLRLHPRG